MRPLFPQTKSGNRGSVPFNVLVRQVGEHASTLTNQLQQTAPRVKIVAVSAEVICQTVDPLGQECNLHLGRTSIFRMCAKLRDDRVFLFPLQRHSGGFLSQQTNYRTHKSGAPWSTQPSEYTIL